MSDDTLTIGKLARAAGVRTSTVRFYERAGLLAPRRRTGSNYRQYDAAAVQRLGFIRSAQASGFKLDDVREMLALTDSDADGPPCDEVTGLIARRLAEVRTRLRELRRVEQTLAAAHASCCRGSPDWCGEIERLKGVAGAVCQPCDSCP